MKSQMHARCAVPVTPDQLQLSGRSLLAPHGDDATSRSRMSFDLADSAFDNGRWSARRTLLFILASNGALWWVIAYALHAAI